MPLYTNPVACANGSMWIFYSVDMHIDIYVLHMDLCMLHMDLYVLLVHICVVHMHPWAAA